MTTPTVGMLYPGYSAEDDYPAFAARVRDAGIPIDLPLIHTRMDIDAHEVGPLLDIGNADYLADGARELVALGAQSVMWACTSGSFVFGWKGAADQVEQLSQACERPASSTSFAFVDACRALNIERVAVAASYPQDIAERFVAFLRAADIEVVGMGSHGIITAAEVGTLGRDQVEQVVTGADLSAHVQAVLVPDTAMHTLAWLDDLERAAGRTVLTANQVTTWKGLDLLGHTPLIPHAGRLFARQS
ncbi:maleate cis-trans isomerase family protein [Demetria terragena]|uniref:maleate cis-trans isomerase family protein n=1 Tax=Demetria terragena TaxID=63959 RepID=UPI00037A4624|nr:hypothetical protein [Demetria terragena]